MPPPDLPAQPASPALLRLTLERSPWRALTLPEDLTDAWRAAHHIAQAVAEVGKGWGDAQADDSHSALEVVEPSDWFADGMRSSFPTLHGSNGAEHPDAPALPADLAPIVRQGKPAIDAAATRAVAPSGHGGEAPPALQQPRVARLALPPVARFPLGPLLRGVAVRGDQPFAAFLSVTGDAIGIVDAATGSLIAIRGVSGARMLDLVDWMTREAMQHTATSGPRQKPEPAPSLPDHPAGHGEPIAAEPPSGEARSVLADLYAGTARMLDCLREELGPFAEQAVTRPQDGAAADGAPRFRFELRRHILVWPHHFDLAWLLVAAEEPAGTEAVENGADRAMIRSVGFGLAVPDEIESSGYWYVSPWARDGLSADFCDPELPIGRWVERGEGVRMAVLPIRELVERSLGLLGDRPTDPEIAATQRRHLAMFFADAGIACLRAVRS